MQNELCVYLDTGCDFLERSSLDSKIDLFKEVIDEMKALTDEISDIDWDLHAIDRVLYDLHKENNQEKINELNQKAEKQMIRKDVVWTKTFMLDGMATLIFRSIAEHFPAEIFNTNNDNVSPKYDEKAWRTAMNKRHPGLAAQYDEVYSFMDDLYDVIHRD